MMMQAEAQAVKQDLFLRNMRALWRNDPSLAIRVDAVPDDDRIAVEPTRSGAWTAKMVVPSGDSVYLHSRYDPVAEAEKMASAVPIEDKFCFVLAGLGLGYHVRALFERLHDQAIIICLEPSIPLIAAALTCLDMTDLISSNRFFIFTDTDKTRIHDRLYPHNARIMIGTQLVKHAPSSRIADEAHREIMNMVSEFVTYTRMTLSTLMSNSRVTCQNIAMNLAAYVTTPPIDILQNRFAGKPGIVIAAGPSLSKNIDQVGALKDHAVLIAVQTALKPLMKRGIIPDFATSLDFHEMSQKFLEGVEGLENVHLVAEPKATWHVIDRFPGPVSLLDNDWARLLIGDKLGARGSLQPGATVAHLAFYLAVYMGCDPIIFVGQDLAFTGHVFYVPGVEIHHAWRSEINRFQSMEQKEWDRIARNRQILRRVHAIDGGEIYTDELLFTYLEQFEKDIAGVAARVIDATEGGAAIRGTQSLTLAETAKAYCADRLTPDLFAYRKTTAWRDPTKLDETEQEISARIDELDEASAVCAELLELLEELKSLTDDPNKFNQRLIRVDELRTKVSRESRAYKVISAATQFAEFRRYAADRKTVAGGATDEERAKRQIDRDVEFLTSVRDGADSVRTILADSLNRVRKAERTS